MTDNNQVTHATLPQAEVESANQLTSLAPQGQKMGVCLCLVLSFTVEYQKLC
jgi:hypothetical protein